MKPGQHPRRWPFRAVDDYLRPHIVEHAEHADQGTTIVAGRLGTTRRQVLRWRQCGLNRVQVDRVATRLGVHPTWLYDDWEGGGT